MTARTQSSTRDRFLSKLPEAAKVLHPIRNSFIPLLCAATLGAAETAKVNYLRDVAPILNKVGCTSGTCHGAAKGKNGFKLSLRGYDAQFDYEALLYDLSGR